MKKIAAVSPEEGYNKEEIFKKEILPLRDEFMKMCKLHDIPTIVTSAVCNLEDGTTKYSSDMVSAITNSVGLNEDKIVKIANVLNGFDVVNHNIEIEFEL